MNDDDQLTDEQIAQTFRRAAGRDPCPPVPRFLSGPASGWTPAELQHINTCPKCEDTLIRIWSAQHPPLATILRWVRDELVDSEASAFLYHLDTDRCSKCRTLVAALELVQETKSTLSSFGRFWRSAIASAGAAGDRLRTAVADAFEPAPQLAGVFGTEDTNPEPQVIRLDDHQTTFVMSHRSEAGRAGWWLDVERRDVPTGTLLRVALLGQDGQPLLDRWLMLRPAFRTQLATTKIDQPPTVEFLPVVARVESADLTDADSSDIQAAFQSAKQNDPRSVPHWQAWAQQALSQVGADGNLHKILSSIADDIPSSTASTHGAFATVVTEEAPSMSSRGDDASSRTVLSFEHMASEVSTITNRQRELAWQDIADASRFLSLCQFLPVDEMGHVFELSGRSIFIEYFRDRWPNSADELVANVRRCVAASIAARIAELFVAGQAGSHSVADVVRWLSRAICGTDDDRLTRELTTDLSSDSEALRHPVTLIDAALRLLQDVSPVGTLVGPIRDMARAVLGHEPREATTRTLQVMTWYPQNDHADVLTLRVDRLEGGRGDFYCDLLATGFVPMTDSFRESLATAWMVAANSVATDVGESDYRWSLSGSLPDKLDQGSLGAGMAILLRALREQSPVEEGVAVTGSLDAEGNIGAVAGTATKILRALGQGYTTIIAPAANQDDVQRRVSQQKCVTYSATFAEAYEVATGFVGGVERVLRQQIEIIDDDLRRRTERSLDEQFVEVALSRGSNPKDKGEDKPQARPEKRSCSMWDFDHTLRSVVLAEPGAGKSTLLQHRVYRHCEQQLIGLTAKTVSPADVEPALFLRASELASLVSIENAPPLADILLDKATAELRRPESTRQRLRTWLRSRLEAGQFLVAIDALDEIADHDQRRKLSDALLVFARQYPVRICLSSRNASFTQPPIPIPQTDWFQIEPLDDVRMQRLVRKWLTDRSTTVRSSRTRESSDRSLTTSATTVIDRPLPTAHAESLLNALKSRHEVWQLLRNPLLLRLVCQMASHEGFDGERTIAKWQRRTQLYPDFVHHLIDRHLHDHTERFTGWRARLVDFASEVALHLQQSDAARNEFSEADLHLAVRQAHESLAPRPEPEYTLKDLTNVGLIVALGPDRAGVSYAWLHRSFQEYLAAVALVRRGLDPCREAATAHCYDPEWRHVLIMIGPLLSESDFVDYIRHLHHLTFDDLFDRPLKLAIASAAEAEDSPGRRGIRENLKALSAVMGLFWSGYLWKSRNVATWKEWLVPWGAEAWPFLKAVFDVGLERFQDEEEFMFTCNEHGWEGNSFMAAMEHCLSNESQSYFRGLLNAQNDYVADIARTVLIHAGDLELLVENLTDVGFMYAHWAAITVVTTVEPPNPESRNQIVCALVELARKDCRCWDHRSVAIRELLRLDRDEGWKIVEELTLEDDLPDDDDVVSELATQWVQREGTALLPRVEGWSIDENAGRRLLAVHSAERLCPAPEASDILRLLSRDDGSENVRDAARRILNPKEFWCRANYVPTPEEAPQLLRDLEGDDPWQAADYLFRLEDDRVVPWLVDTLRNKNAEIWRKKLDQRMDGYMATITLSSVSMEFLFRHKECLRPAVEQAIDYYFWKWGEFADLRPQLIEVLHRYAVHEQEPQRLNETGGYAPHQALSIPQMKTSQRWEREPLFAEREPLDLSQPNVINFQTELDSYMRRVELDFLQFKNANA
jgi:hypothetical protein